MHSALQCGVAVAGAGVASWGSAGAPDVLQLSHPSHQPAAFFMQFDEAAKFWMLMARREGLHSSI